MTLAVVLWWLAAGWRGPEGPIGLRKKGPKDGFGLKGAVWTNHFSPSLHHHPSSSQNRHKRVSHADNWVEAKLQLSIKHEAVCTPCRVWNSQSLLELNRRVDLTLVGITQTRGVDLSHT